MEDNNTQVAKNQKKTNVRWIMVGLLFFATTINYIDRQVIGLLKPYIQDELHWSEIDYGHIVTAFQIAYAFGMLACGKLIDKMGLRLGYIFSITVWSIATMLHALVNSVAGFSAVRALLGFGEAGNFPSAVKTIAEWFPKKSRAFATGIFNSGSTTGAIVAPIIVVAITLHWGWRSAFIVTGALGLIWVILWLLIYKAPHLNRHVNKAELDYINSDRDEDEEKKVAWRELFKYKQTYAIIFTRFLTDWVWWFFLFWAPDFLAKEQGIDLKATVLPLIIIYLMADAGGITGGIISSRFIMKGRTADFARKTTILIFALMILPLNVVPYVKSLWGVVILIGMATATHQAWASNIYTIVSDVYPKHVVASMTGISSVGGAIGGALASTFVGFVLDATHSYTVIFMIASCMYLMAWLTLKLFVPIKRIQF